MMPTGFAMPMFRSFVSEKMRPWIYVVIAFTFQFSGGLYLGTLAEMMGETTLMREDLQMCLYANLAGMAVYFPILFRMKFRFTNKTLLCAAATGVLLCNAAAPHITFLPLLWTLCFVEGMCKIQGTFECMSNIQLWMTPKRDFTVFFPMLHIVILGSMQLSDMLATSLMYYYHWDYMQMFICGVMMVDLLVLTLCTRHFRMMKKLPLFGIDWLGMVLWAALLLEIAYLFDYGEWYDWWHSPVVRRLTVAILLTALIAVWRMLTIRHPYYEPKMWTYRHLLPILALITLVEMLLATEHVLEEVYLGEVMHYSAITSVRTDVPVLIGVLTGCLFSYWWMHVKRFNYLRLIVIGLCGIVLYQLGFYFIISQDIHISQLYPFMASRGLAYCLPDNIARYGAALDN